MPSPDNPHYSDVAARTALLLLAVGINALEYLFPRIPFLPWLKPGLANAVTIIWIVRWGAADALFFTIVRSWITSFYFGFSLVSLVLSLSGGLAATAGMGLLWLLAGRRGWLGLTGLGIAGAVLHNAGQLAGVYVLLTASAALWYQVPFMLAASLLFGAITGLLAYALWPILGKEYAERSGSRLRFPVSTLRYSGSRLAAGGFVLAASIALALIRTPVALAAASLAASILAVAVAGGKVSRLWYPLSRFWLLFLFVAVMYLFFSYGRTVAGIPFVTYEGLRETGLQWLRLWAWIELSTLLVKIEFNRIALATALRYVPFGRATITASLFALELFPGFADLLRKHARIDLRKGVRNSRKRIVSAVESLYGAVVGLVDGNIIRCEKRLYD